MRLLLVALVAACSQPAKPPPDNCGPNGQFRGLASVCPPQPGPSPTVPIDAPAVSQEEKLAAIQHAMNQLDEAVQGCWAAAATDRFDIEGELVAQIDIGDGAGAATIVGLARDTVRNQRLGSCVIAVLTNYPWAPPLKNETIQLPFRFKAPDGQSVIDRSLVEWHGQSSISVAVLLDENNSNNAAASILEVAIQPRVSTGMRVAERTELWYFLGEAEIKSAMGTGGARKTLNKRMPAGTMMYVPKGAAREVIATGPDMHAVVVMVPGGREGTARAGALPTATATTGASLPVLLEKGTKYGPATIFLDGSIVKTTPLAASILELGGDAKVPEHVHGSETELLYLLAGTGTMPIVGQDMAITATSVVQVPPNTKHAFNASAPVRALQIYTPAGPEQRFKAPPK